MSEPGQAADLQWCKDRALVYVERGDLVGAMASFISDLRTAGLSTATTDVMMSMVGSGAVMRGDVGEMRRLIEGFR